MKPSREMSRVVAVAAPAAPIPMPGLVFAGISMFLCLAYVVAGLAG